MNTYIFKTTTTMKDYNRKHWWIDSNIVREITICADSLTEALNEYRERVNDTEINISKNALKTKQPMFVDCIDGTIKQVGYVITGSADFEYNCYKWTKQYIDLWVNILTVIDTEF